MDNLYVEGKKVIPEIKFDASTGILEIEGSSYPENALDFFAPVIKWVEDYISGRCFKIEMNIRLEYFNTSSSKALLDIFDILNECYNKGIEAKVRWYYKSGNESIYESGEEFSEDLELPFEIIEVE